MRVPDCLFYPIKDDGVDLDKEMANRVTYMQRACKLRRKIQNLVHDRNYEGLLDLHKRKILLISTTCSKRKINILSSGRHSITFMIPS